MNTDITNIENLGKFPNEASRVNYYMTEDKSYDNKKRLARYVAKCQDLVLNKFLKEAFPQLFEKHNETDPTMQYLWPNIYTMNDAIKHLLKAYFLVFTSDDKGEMINALTASKNSMINYIVPTYTFGVAIAFLGKKAISMLNCLLFDQSFEKDAKGTRHLLSFDKIVDNNFFSVCQDYLSKRRADNPNVNNENKYSYLPESMSDLAFLFYETMSRVYTDLILITAQSTADAMSDWQKQISDDMKSSNMVTLQEQNQVLTNENSELQTQNKRLVTENKHLQDRVSMLEDADAEYIHILERKLAKLRKEYDHLAASIPEKQMSIETNNEECSVYTKGTVDVDVNKNYLFVCGEVHPNKNQILEAFPNSIIYEGQKLTSLKYDMVVFLISHLDHATYYKVKQHCQAQKDTYIQCSLTNIDGIKDTIWNVINN